MQKAWLVVHKKNTRNL